MTVRYDDLIQTLIDGTPEQRRVAADELRFLELPDAPHCATCGATWNVSVIDGFPPTCWDCYELAVMRLAAAVDA